MLGSQVLETAIGLVVMFFVLSLAASQIVEVLSRVLSQRAKNLERTIGGLLAGTSTTADPTKAKDTKSLAADVEAALQRFKGTAVYDAVRAGSGSTWFKGQRRPSYISAKLFADAAIELVLEEVKTGTLRADAEKIVPGLFRRLEPILVAGRVGMLDVKADLERTFDEAMERAEGAYRRWVSLWLFLVGLLVALSLNASTFTVAAELWRDPVTRAAVAEAATSVDEETTSREITSVAAATDKLTELSLPIGWTQEARDRWWPLRSSSDIATRVADVGGWLMTALLLMLGAPFWFDLLTRLTSLRASGPKPPPAAQDPMSASAALGDRRAAGGAA